MMEMRKGSAAEARCFLQAAGWSLGLNLQGCHLVVERY
jgi:hypothetical protein